MVERGVKRSKPLLSILDDRNRFLTTVLIGNTIVLLGADSLATYLFIQLGFPDAALISTVVMTFVILLFGEIIPKTVAVSDTDRWALRLAPTMKAVAWFLTPLVAFFEILRDLLLKPLGVKNTHHIFVTEDDIRTLVNVGAEQRVIEEQEREMIHSIIEFGDTIVREDDPRPGSWPSRSTSRHVARSTYDRRGLPASVYQGQGRRGRRGPRSRIADRARQPALAGSSLRSLMRHVSHVPETKKIAKCYARCNAISSMSIVVDAYGGPPAGDHGRPARGDRRRDRDEHDEDEQ